MMNLPCEICGMTDHPVEEDSYTGLLICKHPDCFTFANELAREHDEANDAVRPLR